MTTTKGEPEDPTEIHKRVEHPKTPHDLRLIIEERNRLSRKIRGVWNASTLRRVARALEER